MARYFSPTQDVSGAARGCMDSLVQGSLVDLFSAYGVAVAPLPRMAGPTVASCADVSASIAFRCSGREGEAGRLLLSVPTPLLSHMKPHEAASIQLDWSRELANQLLGRIKNRLLPFAMRLDIGGSSMIKARDVLARLQTARDVRVYAGRTLRGVVLVALEGLPNDSALKYVGNAAPLEGAMLWL